MELNVGQTKVFTPYLVKIQAKNNEGDSTEDPEEKTLYSFEDSKFTKLVTSFCRLFFLSCSDDPVRIIL